MALRSLVELKRRHSLLGVKGPCTKDKAEEEEEGALDLKRAKNDPPPNLGEGSRKKRLR